MKKYLAFLPQVLMLIGLLFIFCPLILEIWDKGWGVFHISWDWGDQQARKQAMFWKYWQWYAGAFGLWGLGLLTLTLRDRR